MFILLSAVLFAAANIFSKFSYNRYPFVESFIWLRWMALLASIPLVLIKISVFKKSPSIETRKPPLGPFILGQATGAAGIILQQFAIKAGNVSVVSALNGVQFFFIFVLASFISHGITGGAGKKNFWKIDIGRLAGLVVLCVGLALIFIL